MCTFVLFLDRRSVARFAGQVSARGEIGSLSISPRLSEITNSYTVKLRNKKLRNSTVNISSKGTSTSVNADSESNCRGCGHADQCRQVWSQAPKGRLGPAGLSLGSAVAFLLPLAGAIGAGGMAHHYVIGSQNDLTAVAIWMEIAAAMGGLVLGIILARFIMPLIGERFPRAKQGLPGQNEVGLSVVEQGRAEQGGAEQGRAEQDGVEQGKGRRHRIKL